MIYIIYPKYQEGAEELRISAMKWNLILKKKNMGFFNTINITGKELKEAQLGVKSQNELILDLFKNNPNKEYTPFEVHSALFGSDQVPVTSVRRAMTTLEKNGDIVKTDKKKMEIYGKPNYCWKLNPPKEEDGQYKMF